LSNPAYRPVDLTQAIANSGGSPQPPAEVGSLLAKLQLLESQLR